MANTDKKTEKLPTEKDKVVVPQPAESKENIAELTKDTQPKEKIGVRKTVQQAEKSNEPDPVVDFDAESIKSIAVNEPIIEDATIIPTESIKPSQKDAPLVIVYELKPIERRSEVAENQESLFELEPFPPKKNGFKKVLEVANDVRTGESPLGGLRQAKDEIFAFNFKKEDKNNK